MERKELCGKAGVCIQGLDDPQHQHTLDTDSGFPKVKIHTGSGFWNMEGLGLISIMTS